MKRAVTLIMASLMLLTSISVYAAGERDETPTAVSEPIVIDWLAYNSYRHPEPDALIIKKMEEKYGVKFNIWFIDEKNWNDALGVRLAAGEMPDYFRIKYSSVVGKYVEQGILAPVTDEMFEQIPNYVKMIDKYDTDKNIYTDVMVDGTIYALKVINITGAYPTIVVWRTDWLKNVGITKIPETIAEFEDAMYKMAKNDPDKNGKDDTYGLSNTAMGVVFGAYGMMPLKHIQKDGLHWTTKNGKLVITAIQPEMKEPLEMLQRWYKDGVIDPEFITGENKGGYWALSHAFMNGRIGLTGLVMATHWNPPLQEGQNPARCLAEFIKVNPDAVYGETVEIGRPPVGPKGESGAHQWGYAGESTGFTTKCVANKEKTNIILKLINDKLGDFELFKLLTYGVEGVHFFTEDGIIKRPADYKEKFGDGTSIGGGTLSGKIANPDFVKRTNPPVWAFIDTYKAPGYTFGKVPPTEAYAQFSSDLDRLTSEYYVEVITGGKNIDTFDDFVRTFRAAGGDEIERQVNEQYNKLMGR